MLKPLFVFVFILSILQLSGQTLSESENLFGQSSKDESENKKAFLPKKAIFPAATLGVSFLLSGSGFEKQLQQDVRNFAGNDFRTYIDDYTQYAPIVQLYGANLAGVKGKHHWFDQTKYLFLSNLASAAITHGLKRIISKERPYGGNHAFPSGHTSLAFTNASVLYQEYSLAAPWLAASGYLFAGTTGALRVANNKHWVSDVLAGASVGILATQLVYHYEPFRNFNPFNRNDAITLVPIISSQQTGFVFRMDF